MKKAIQTITPGTFGVFLWDEANPPALWEFQGVSANGEPVFTTGYFSGGDYRLIHEPLSEFWPLATL